MARAATLATMTLRAQQLSDQDIPATSTTFVTSSEWTDNVNQALTEVYDFLVQAGPADYYAADQSYTTTTGVKAYALPADFRTLVGLYQLDPGTGRRIPISAIEPSMLGQVVAPSVSGLQLVMEYVPAPPALSSPSDTFDGVSGWEELISAVAARKAMAKQEDDLSAVEQMIVELRERVGGNAAKRARGPRFIANSKAMDDRGPWNNRWWGATPFPLVGYRLRAGNIELYQPIYGIAA